MALNIIPPIIDAQEFFFGTEKWEFLFEVVLRCFISFIVVLIALRFTGKKGVRQLTVFELVIILTLGSAAGDMGFYKDVGVLPAVLTIVSIIGFYKLVTYLLLKSDKFERLVEGEPVIIIEDGRYTEDMVKNENISFDEFFMELRLAGIEHLGQVRLAILEVNGDVSVFKNPKELVKPGLHILPNKIKEFYTERFPADGLYACVCCGYTAPMPKGDIVNCASCGKTKWSEGCDTNWV
ncbi:DUF421 domain-containing protein [Niabella ginsengisoli]|uniref:DUF421 domain-containing protein n=1 Tax=Niabella ginsengisoli TaxID=522298 RepID=A0ABS9SQZ7_9BACT|nr:DUF421 domain-containing protein [Niabella ginsengisoli]MCH5600818.1 DUF421 domain-containing protein [Niabella ginsengisoli]